MKNIKKILLLISILLSFSTGVVNANEERNVNLTIRDQNIILFQNSVPLRPSGDIEINGHALNANSVLSVLNDADTLSENFSITDLTYYESYGSFYVKCINSKCDNWQYTVNSNYSSIGMDKNILSGGENVYLYFGPQYRTTLSSSSINTGDSITVKTEDYNYQDNTWIKRSGVTVGITQPNPNDAWTPIEVKTQAVDENGNAFFSELAEGVYNVGIKEDYYFPTETLTVTKKITDINLMIRSGSSIIFSGIIPLNTSPLISLNDSNGIPREINGKSVLSLLSDTDISSSLFSISNLEYYDSFGSLYLKCITSESVGEKCDNWQYTVNDTYSSVGMDKNILSGGENVYLYFGSQYRTRLSSNTINTTDSLTATAEEYNYQDDTWKKRTGISIGITKTNPDNPWSPLEIKMQAVNENGITVFTSLVSGSYKVGVKEDYYFPAEELTVNNLVIATGGGSYSAPSSTVKKEIKPIVKKNKFDLKKAIDFIISKQKENGSFGESLYTDWVAISLMSADDKYVETSSIIKIIKHLGEFKLQEMSLTDAERHAMALMSLGLNPYNTNGENYIKKITESFDGKQFGDADQDNDDIFALIVLTNAGFSEKDKMIEDSIFFILSKQKQNGSWNESVDMTGAAITALSNYKENINVSSALQKAKNFLKEKQKDDGGWGNVSSTSWAIGGILGLLEKPENWIKNENSPLDYLGKNQDAGGGIKKLSEEESDESKIWETSYAITALSLKTWNQIMQKFEKIGEKEQIQKTIETKKDIQKEKVVEKKIKENIEKKNTKTIEKEVLQEKITKEENKEKNIPKRNWFLGVLSILFNL
jgi:hypothetical protein